MVCQAIFSKATPYYIRSLRFHTSLTLHGKDWRRCALPQLPSYTHQGTGRSGGGWCMRFCCKLPPAYQSASCLGSRRHRRPDLLSRHSLLPIIMENQSGIHRKFYQVQLIIMTKGYLTSKEYKTLSVLTNKSFLIIEIQK